MARRRASTSGAVGTLARGEVSITLPGPAGEIGLVSPAFSPDPTGTPSPSPRDLQCCLKVRQVRHRIVVVVVFGMAFCAYLSRHTLLLNFKTNALAGTDPASTDLSYVATGNVGRAFVYLILASHTLVA